MSETPDELAELADLLEWKATAGEYISISANSLNRIANALRRLATAEAALSLYADPDSYFAIAIWSDPPCGWFADDFGPDDEFPDYERPMPGKAAREYFEAVAQREHP
jgi:hypothetical protein